MRTRANLKIILTTGKSTFFLDLSESLELLDEKFKWTMINTLRNLIEKTDSMKENVLCKQRVWNTKKQKEMLEIQNTIIEFFLKCL